MRAGASAEAPLRAGGDFRFFTEICGITDTSSVWPAASHLPLKGKARNEGFPLGGKLAREARLMRGISHKFP